ncbi:hypothetical protein ACFOW1_15210 [Parasediminibacterium paludis]|uniref:Fibronectin type-III domain-containing protein n=2 Tax=Parasediminibacterium paludis TaxID=908966 RepID=A0ABV8Q1Q3_9BACT
MAQAPITKIGIKAQGFRTEKKVVVRWLLDNAKQWRYALKKGFDVERAEGTSNNFIKLNKNVILPISEAQLSKYDTNSYVFQAMVFLLSKPNSEEARGAQDDQLYSLYFLNSSYETEAAVQSASAFVDTTIEKGKTYTYRVKVANTNINQTVANTFISAENSLLPKSPQLNAVFGNRTVAFDWNIKDVSAYYFATLLERSTDSIQFKRIGLPYIKIPGENEKPEDSTVLKTTDAIPNKIKFYYRLKGINIFGLTGESANVVSGVGGPDLNVAPLIKSVDSTNRNKLTIAWTLPDSLNDVVDRYEIYKSTKADTLFAKVDEVKGGNTKQKEMSLIIKDESSYFKVKAIGNRNGQTTTSSPFFYQLIDSIPPAIPVGITGKVDSLGVVTLQWANNTEPDLLGYRVLRVLKRDGEFAILNATPQGKNIFLDTLPLNQLNSAMFYKVVAVDQRYNESKASDIVAIKRPDIIPPAPPRLAVVVEKDKQMYLEWIKSFSKDVASYNIYKLISSDTSKTWNKIATAKNTDTAYIDKAVTAGNTYYYTVEAVDSSALLSPRSEPLSASIKKAEEIKKGVKNIVTYVSTLYKYIELSWQNTEEDAKEYWVYRSTSGEALSLISVLPASKKRYVDEDVKPSTEYKYAIKVLYKDGRSSKMERADVVY